MTLARSVPCLTESCDSAEECRHGAQDSYTISVEECGLHEHRVGC